MSPCICVCVWEKDKVCSQRSGAQLHFINAKHRNMRADLHTVDWKPKQQWWTTISSQDGLLWCISKGKKWVFFCLEEGWWILNEPTGAVYTVWTTVKGKLLFKVTACLISPCNMLLCWFSAIVVCFMGLSNQRLIVFLISTPLMSKWN